MSTNQHSMYTRERKVTGKEPNRGQKTNKMN